MKAAVIYTSLTGNTEIMAECIYKAYREKNGPESAELFPAGSITPDKALDYGILILGCPAMGSEVLEEEIFEPFFSGIEPGIKGKKVALFGSYGWGDGQWMRDWKARCEAAGAEVAETLTVHETPEPQDLGKCVEFAGKI